MQPLRVLEIPNSNGILTTDVNKMDKIARDAWEKVFRGNVKDDDKMTNEFIAKYSKYIYKQEEEQTQPLEWRDVKFACSNTNSAGGLDVWTKKEPHMLSDEGFKWITQWLQLIEDTTNEWPKDQRQARAVFLCKDSNKAQDPMSYRIIKINSTFYRVYGSVRMKNLQRWTDKWATKNMFAGVPGVGAEEGWYITQIAFETLRLQGKEITTGSIDVYK